MRNGNKRPADSNTKEPKLRSYRKQNQACQQNRKIIDYL